MASDKSAAPGQLHIEALLSKEDHSPNHRKWRTPPFWSYLDCHAKMFEATYPDRLCPAWSVIVKGETGSRTNGIRFEINFLNETGEQVTFHFNPRLTDSVILRDSFLSNLWGQEEMTDTIPLEAKELFQVEIYSVQQDETKVLQYKHWQKQLPIISKLQIISSPTFPLWKSPDKGSARGKSSPASSASLFSKQSCL